MGIRPLQLDVTEGTTNNTTVPTLGKVEDLIGVENLWDRVTGTPNYLIPNTGADDVGATAARITKIWGTDVESTNMYTVSGTSINANAVLDLTSAEVTQLSKIGTTTIVTTQWDILGLSNQGIATTDTVTFAQVTVDNLVLNGNTLSSTSGNINITPDNAADDIIINGHWSFDGKTLVAISDSDTTLTAYAGKNIAIEGVTFDGGVIGTTGARVTKIWATDLEVTNMPTVGGTSINANAVLDLTSAEVAQLAKIGTTTIETTQWDILGLANQGIATTNSVTFAQVTVDSIVLNAAAITITENSTDYTFECKRVAPGDGNDLYIYGSNAINAGAGADAGDIIISTREGVAGGVDGEIYLQVGGVTKASITDDYFVSTGYVLQTGIFAEIFVADASTAQSIATGAGYTKSTAFTTDGQSSNCTAAATNDKITITKTGKYRVSGSCSATSGKANLTWRGAAFLNGVEQSQVHWKRKMTTTTDSGDMGFTGFVDVTSAPWDLDFRLRHDDGGNQNFTIEYANLNVEYMGAT